MNGIQSNYGPLEPQSAMILALVSGKAIKSNDIVAGTDVDT